MLIRAIIKPKQLWTLLLSQTAADSANKANAYIPIRPLREQRNQLFALNQSSNLPFFVKLMTLTPLFAFGLEGLTSDWSWWVVGGCAFGFYFAASSINMINFYRAHQAYQIDVNKNMTKYDFHVNKNYFSERWEKTLLKSQRKTFQQRFRERLKEGTLALTEQVTQQLKSLPEDELISRIQKYRNSRKQIILEIDRNQIKSFELMSNKQVRALIKQRFIEMRQQKFNPIFQNYSNEKEEKKILVIQTRPIDGQPIMVFAPLDKNIDKKFEEYLRALGEGKTIASI